MNHHQGNWNNLYKIGGAATVASILLIPIQIGIFIIWPPPTAIIDWFSLLQESWLLGLLSLDLLYILNNTFVLILYLGLYAALKRANEALMAIAFLLGIVGATIYYSSNTGFEMLALSNQYAATTSEAMKAMLLTSGQTMMTIYTGTAFNVYYVLNGIALFIMAIVMLQSKVFGKGAAYWGLAAAILMIIPSTAGTIGMIFALTSLIPWIVFCILVARNLFRLAKGNDFHYLSVE